MKLVLIFIIIVLFSLPASGITSRGQLIHGSASSQINELQEKLQFDNVIETTLTDLVNGKFPTAKNKRGDDGIIVKISSLKVIKVYGKNPSDGDLTFDVTDGIVPRVHFEIIPRDQTYLQSPPLGAIIDVIGIPYCDKPHEDKEWHGYTCWEIHPVLDWSFSRSDTLIQSYIGTFFYPWYNKTYHWNAADHKPPFTWASNYLPDIVPNKFDPATELYDSTDPVIIKKQLEWLKQAGIQFIIVSWWGQQKFTDKGLQSLIKVMESNDNPYPELKFVVFYEREGHHNITTTETLNDLRYIQQKYVTSKYYMHINEKPVLFVFTKGSDTLNVIPKWKDLREETGFYIVMKDNPLQEGAPPDSMDSWFSYRPTKRYAQVGNFSASISAGYWEYHETPRLARDLNSFEEAVKQLAAANVQFKLILTWNEWHEGTQIEPGEEIIHDDQNGFRPGVSYGDQYLNILSKYLIPPNPAQEEVVDGDKISLYNVLISKDNEVEKEVIIQTTLKNSLPSGQKFVYIIQIKDSDGITLEISYKDGILSSYQSNNFISSWIPKSASKYTIEIYVWSNLEQPEPLLLTPLKSSVVVK